MTYVLVGGLVLLGLLFAAQYVRQVNIRKLVRTLRWVVGGAGALFAGFLLLRGRVELATVVGAGAFSILRFGRLGPLVFESNELDEDNESAVRSRYFSMTLDHASGDVSGRVIAGRFRGRDLLSLGEDDTRALLAEVADDPDSLALLETWLDRNRTGWREYFAEEEAGAASAAPSSEDPDAEAYRVLGLEPGATADEIREAHHKLMKAVHPDQGGSTYLAAKINAAKDRLLKRTR